MSDGFSARFHKWPYSPREVEIGHRSALEVEIAKGLNVGEQVIRHPSNDIDEGTRARGEVVAGGGDVRYFGRLSATE